MVKDLYYLLLFDLKSYMFKVWFNDMFFMCFYIASHRIKKLKANEIKAMNRGGAVVAVLAEVNE